MNSIEKPGLLSAKHDATPERDIEHIGRWVTYQDTLISVGNAINRRKLRVLSLVLAFCDKEGLPPPVGVVRKENCQRINGIVCNNTLMASGCVASLSLSRLVNCIRF